ncbi:hypothetical protein DPMN_028071 [Dreissena polymorpha]|uniref:Uncharacterized protein n=1 Tax=Dreissena polymorpha TaxID=45954 RepID=A0A9D4REZ3_DREPO|nr:hypothetical protein DPMN_028071 [Dreissena polymorpha]
MVGMCSDGAANMTCIKSGLAALLRREVGEEFLNVRCLAHRLELAVRDVFKTVKLYDKLMTLLIGLNFFYMKHNNKNKNGLITTMAALNVKGLLPPKVTGTCWLSHIYDALTSLMRTHEAYAAHL